MIIDDLKRCDICGGAPCYLERDYKKELAPVDCIDLDLRQQQRLVDRIDAAIIKHEAAREAVARGYIKSAAHIAAAEHHVDKGKANLREWQKGLVAGFFLSALLGATILWAIHLGGPR